MPAAFQAPTMRFSDLILQDAGYSPGGSSTGIWRAFPPQGGLPVGLYKAYSEKMLGKLDTASLDALICWRQELSPADRKYLDAFCAFPQFIVLDGDRVTGILMDEAPNAFFRTVPGQDRRQPRHAEELGRPYRKDERPGLYYFPPPQKAALLGVLLERLIWLHGHQVVVSDLHPRNMLVTSDLSMCDVYLLDCDSFWLGDRHAFPPHSPEMWRVGDGATASRATDLAKFAMVTDRVVKENFSNPEFSEASLLRLLPSQHVTLLRNMWEVDPALRSEQLTSMAQSWTYLVTSPPGRGVRLRKWTDEAGYVPWDEQAPPAEPVPAGPEPVVPVQPIAEPPAPVPTTRPVTAGRGYTTSGRKTAAKSRDLTVYYGIIAAVVAVIVVAFLILYFGFAVWP